MFYEKREGSLLQCNLCSHRCKIPKGKRGICGVRENKDGTLYSLVYGRPISCAVDPIEKKPLFHFLPGSRVYSIATEGCNFRCLNCQNYDISQTTKSKEPASGKEVTPMEIVKAAKLYSCESIAYTYTEPTVFFEYAYDTAKLASEQDIKNVFVTNGYITETPLRKLAPYLDAANIDLKSIDDQFYRKICGARLQPVLDAIRLYEKLGIWIEITTLVIPSLNDSEENFKNIASFIADIDEGIPWHISRFFPAFKLDYYPPTPKEVLNKAMKIGLEAGLKYVYQGNFPGKGETTYCHTCKGLLIERHGYRIMRLNLVDSQCSYCNSRIEGTWE